MHQHSIHVYPTDCDMLGHVNHATMITFLEHARWAMLEPEMTARDFMEGGVWTVVRHMTVEYLHQAVPGDDLVIRSGLVSVGNTSFRMRQDVRHTATARVVTQADIAFVCVGRDGRPVKVPDVWRSVIPRWSEGATP